MMEAGKESNKATVAKILKGYGQGDLRPLLDVIDDSVEWNVHAPRPFFRMGGTRKGRDGVMEVAAAVSAEYLIQRYDVKEIIAEGNTVWAISEATYMRDSVVLKFDSATRWVFRNGKVVEFHGFFDSAGLLAQQDRLPASAA